MFFSFLLRSCLTKWLKHHTNNSSDFYHLWLGFVHSFSIRILTEQKIWYKYIYIVLSGKKYSESESDSDSDQIPLIFIIQSILVWYFRKNLDTLYKFASKWYDTYTVIIINVSHKTLHRSFHDLWVTSWIGWADPII